MSQTLTSDNIDPRLARQLQGRCSLARCGRPLKDGSAWCAECDDVQRGKAAVRQAKYRTKLARAKLCIDGCGARVGRSERGRRCSNCTKANRTRAEDWREDHECDGESANVTPDAPRTKLEVQPDGYTRVRTIGRGTKAVTREDRDQNLRDELTWAISHLTWLRDEGIAALRSPSIAELGRIQRDEASRIVADRALEAARLARGVAREIHAKRVAEIDREIREALEADAEID